MDTILALILMVCPNTSELAKAQCLNDKVQCMGGKHKLYVSVQNEAFYGKLLDCLEQSAGDKMPSHHRYPN